MPNFKIYSEDNKQIIKHLAFPKFTAAIAFDSPTSDLEDIKMIDSCVNAPMLAKVMSEASDFILNHKKVLV